MPNRIQIYPNPAHDIITIQTNECHGVIKIYNILGRKVIHREIADLKTPIYISDLVQGTYLVNLISDLNVKTIKFIKE
jgi:hypothetical protein